MFFFPKSITLIEVLAFVAFVGFAYVAPKIALFVVIGGATLYLFTRLIKFFSKSKENTNSKGE